MIQMSHHVSTLSSAFGSRILALHAMFQRSYGGQKGVAEENRGKSVWSLEFMNQLYLDQRCLLPVFTLHCVVWKNHVH